MASLASRIGIWNAALDLLHEQPLVSVDDTRPAALWLSRNYDQQRDYLLERINWKFAVTRAALAADAAAPAFDWTYRYQLPADCLKLFQPTTDGAWMGKPIQYEVESGFILTDAPPPLRIRYMRRVTGEGEFSNGFCEVLALRLAMKMAHWMTGKATMTQTLAEMLKVSISEVRQAEAFQMVGGVYYDSDIADMRETVF